MNIPFGRVDLQTLNAAERSIRSVFDRAHITEGPLTDEFEREFAKAFGWKYAVATSSGTTAGEVLWSALREVHGQYDHASADSSGVGDVLTPACAFVATASCLMAAGLRPVFVDVELSTLNINTNELEAIHFGNIVGVQFVATMGKLKPLSEVARLCGSRHTLCVADLCEAHGARLNGELPNKYVTAAIYSLYPAHLVVGGEGGVICCDDAKLANLCRSVKSHGRPCGSNYFDFQRVGYNAKWSDLHAAVALASLQGFSERNARRRWVRQRLLESLQRFEDEIILYPEMPDEEIAPHAFPVVLRKDTPDGARLLIAHLMACGIEVKTLFGSLAHHRGFQSFDHKPGDFPVAERIGRTGLHFGCGEYMGESEINFVATQFEKFFS